jgi:hypothetical protein
MSQAKLNQIIAVVQGKKSRAQRLLTDTHRGWNREAISGITKTYTPKDEDGDKLPPERKRIHLNVVSKIEETLEELQAFWDVVTTQETGNTGARASIVIDDKPLLTDQPVTVLLFLEKQAIDLHTFVAQLPTLPLDREWAYDTNRDCFVTAPTESLRTQKQPEVITKAPATTEHPAQTELYLKDVVVGTWETTHMSSAIPAQAKADALRRVEALQDAIKSAREQANSAEVEQIKIAETVLEYVFGDLLRAQS